MPPCAPPDCRRKATASRLPPHLVPHADRRMEDKGLSSGRLAPPLFREGDGSGVARSDQGSSRSGRKLLRRAKKPGARQSTIREPGPDLLSDPSDSVVVMGQSNRITLVFLFLSLITLYGCQDLVPRDTQSLFFPRLQRSEIFGFLAGFGTTFAAVPDLVSMLKRRSRAGMYPMMAAIMGTFQIL